MQSTNRNPKVGAPEEEEMVDGRYHPVIVDLRGRVAALELKENEKHTELALIKQDIAYIKATQAEVTAGIKRILWAIVLSAVAAATTFVLSGGLVIVQQAN